MKLRDSITVEIHPGHDGVIVRATLQVHSEAHFSAREIAASKFDVIRAANENLKDRIIQHITEELKAQ